MYIMGIEPSRVRTSTEGAEFALGSLGANAGVDAAQTVPTPKTGPNGPLTDGGPKAYVYCSFASGATAGHVVIFDNSYAGLSATATLAAATTGFGKQIGVVVATVAAGGFGWVQVYGKCTFLVVAATAIRSPVSLSGTAGAFDDLVADGSIAVTGVYIDAVNSTTGTGMLYWPSMVPDVA